MLYLVALIPIRPPMPLYMDIHRSDGEIDVRQLAADHQKDLEAQGRHGVKFLRYWFDADKRTIFCLSQAPRAEATLAVHRDTGHPTDEIYHVTEGK